MHGKISRTYQKVDGGHINFYKLFAQLGISEDEQKVIAILVGAHKMLTQLLSKPLEQVTHNTLELVNSFIKEANYNCSDMRKLLSMVALVQLADAYAALFPVMTSGPSSLFDKDLIVSPPHPANDTLIQLANVKLWPQAKQFIKTIINYGNTN